MATIILKPFLRVRSFRYVHTALHDLVNQLIVGYHEASFHFSKYGSHSDLYFNSTCNHVHAIFTYMCKLHTLPLLPLFE